MEGLADLPGPDLLPTNAKSETIESFEGQTHHGPQAARPNHQYAALTGLHRRGSAELVLCHQQSLQIPAVSIPAMHAGTSAVAVNIQRLVEPAAYCSAAMVTVAARGEEHLKGPQLPFKVGGMPQACGMPAKAACSRLRIAQSGGR